MEFDLSVENTSFSTMLPDFIAHGDEFNNLSTNTNRSIGNGTGGLPAELFFGEVNLITVAAYSCLFVIAASGNLTVFITLFRNRNHKSRVNMFIMHLSIADLIVAFVMMPLEIAWHATVEWRAGDIGCRIMMFFRVFGLYLSSFVLVVISLDRYFAILHPLSLNDADKRGKIMLVFAWLFSVIASLPQSIIFHEEVHPHFPWFTQCVTFHFFPTDNHKLVYNLFHMTAMYGLPLVIITLSYTLILREISKKTRQSKEELEDLNSGKTLGRLRRSAVGNIERARSKTLKMTIVIVSVFVFCWTPYFVIATWHWFDSASARRVDSMVQKGLFMFAVSNSCVNPIVYGLFTINFKREFRRCCCCLKSQWRSRKYEGYTGTLNTTVRDGGQKSMVSRASYSSARASQSSSGLKVNIDKTMNANTPVRFTAQVYSKRNKNISDNETPKRSESPSSDSRVNLNNFVAVQLPSEDETEDTNVC